MRNVAKEKELSLGNLEAHLLSVKQNIRDANGELERLLDKVEAESTLLNSLVVSKKEVQSELEVLRKLRQDILRNNSEERAELDRRQTQLAIAEEEFAYDCQEKLNVLSTELGQLRDKKNDVALEVANTERALLDTTKQLNLLEQSKQRLLEETRTQELALRQLEQELDEATKAAQTEHKSIAKGVKEAMAELKELQDIIEEEKAKVVIPRENLAREQAELAKKQQNLLILTTRFQNKFEKVFPGQKVII